MWMNLWYEIMNNAPKTLNDVNWEKLFSYHNILKYIKENGFFTISAKQIRQYREPRLMTKFDHSENLPQIFSSNRLSILPISNHSYYIAPIAAYHGFEDVDSAIARFSIPPHLQSLDHTNISSEAVALNCALVSGIIADFLEEEVIFPTVAGKMGTGTFEFTINGQSGILPYSISVNKARLEIDAAYEGVHSLAIFEAKRDIAKDFLIRQLYYPYRLWKSRICKQIRPVFFIYSNGIYRLYEYKFTDTNNYNSLFLVKFKKYSVEDTAITANDIQRLIIHSNPAPEPAIPFPQADKFERVINLCELLYENSMSQEEITEQYSFDTRQTKYYTDAGRYLDLIKRSNDNGTILYELTEAGKSILSLNYRQRQFAFCERILSHTVFCESMKMYFLEGKIPQRHAIVQIMQQSSLYNISSAITFERRASTIRGWLKWIVSLINS